MDIEKQHELLKREWELGRPRNEERAWKVPILERLALGILTIESKLAGLGKAKSGYRHADSVTDIKAKEEERRLVEERKPAANAGGEKLRLIQEEIDQLRQMIAIGSPEQDLLTMNQRLAALELKRKILEMNPQFLEARPRITEFGSARIK